MDLPGTSPQMLRSWEEGSSIPRCSEGPTGGLRGRAAVAPPGDLF